MISKRIAAAQKAVEAQNFASRKHVLEYDDVMNKQRQAVYSMRRSLLEGTGQKERILDIIEGITATYVEARCSEKTHSSNWDWAGLESDFLTEFGVKIHTDELQNLDRRQVEEDIREQLVKRYQEKEDMIGAELMRATESMIMLNVIDNQWKDHLLSMDHLKEGIGLRGYGQKDPLIEYKKESYTMFQDMMDRIEDETARYLFFMQRADAVPEEEVPQNVPYPELWNAPKEDEDDSQSVVAVAAPSQRQAQVSAAQNSVIDLTRHIERKKQKELDQLQFVGGESSTAKKPVLAKAKAGRNDACPCGSGKKYKKCCGA
jgi:preprotein translocase subunit SecA